MFILIERQGAVCFSIKRHGNVFFSKNVMELCFFILIERQGAVFFILIERQGSCVFY